MDADDCFAPSTLECPVCGTISKRHSKRTRRVKDIHLEQPKILTIKVGVYRCPSCQKFFRFRPPCCEKWKHYSKRAIEKARQAVGEDKTTFAGLKRRLERDFHIRPSISTGYRWFHAVADEIDLARDYEPWAAEGFSGYLAVDELYDHYAILVATDPVNDKTLSVRLCESASEEELRAFLRHLKFDLGLIPKVITTDGKTLYKKIPREVWPKVQYQLCVFHLVRLVTKQVLKGVTSIARKLRKDKNADVKKFGQKLWKARYCFVTRPENLEDEPTELVRDLCSADSDVNLLRDFMVEVFALFDKDQTREEAIGKHMILLVDHGDQYKRNLAICKALHHLRPEQFFRAITFLDHPDCPRTTNHVERANRYYRKRAKSHYRNRTKRAIWNMVKCDLMVRKAKKTST